LYKRRKFYITALTVVFVVIALAIALLLFKMIVAGSKRTACDEVVSHGGDESSFRDLSYAMHTKDGKEITIKSDKVIETGKNRYVFENVKSTFTLSSGDVVTVQADITNATNESRTKCDLSGNVRLFTKSGLSLQTQKAFVDFDKKIVQGNGEVALELSPTNEKSGKKTALKGKNFCFDFHKNTLTVLESVKGNVNANTITSGNIVICFENPAEGSVKKIDATQNPTFATKYYTVSAKNSIVYSPGKVHANGNVIFAYHKSDKNIRLKSEDATVTIDDGGNVSNIVINSAFTAHTPNAIIMADRGLFADNRISAFGNVVISGDDGDIFGESAVFDVSSGEIQLNKSSGIVSEDSLNRSKTDKKQ
jgi:hypothetical protein